MATIKEKTDISELQKNVAVMQNDIKYIARSQDDIKKQLDNLQYPSIVDFSDLKIRVNKIEEYNDKNKLGAAFSDIFANKALTFVILGVLLMLGYYLYIHNGVK